MACAFHRECLSTNAMLKYEMHFIIASLPHGQTDIPAHTPKLPGVLLANILIPPLILLKHENVASYLQNQHYLE